MVSMRCFGQAAPDFTPLIRRKKKKERQKKRHVSEIQLDFSDVIRGSHSWLSCACRCFSLDIDII